MVKNYKKLFFTPPSQPTIWVWLGLLLVSLIFWNRFLRLRWPRELEDFQLFWVCLLGLSSLFIFLWTCKEIFMPGSLEPPARLRPWLDQPWCRGLSWVTLRMALAPQEWLRYVLGKLMTLDRIGDLVPGGLKYLEPWSSPREMEQLVLIYQLSPALIPPMVMHLEIILGQKLEYFYSSLFFLALPLCLGAFLAILSYLADYGRWLLQEQGLKPTELQQGSSLSLYLPGHWSQEKQNYWGEIYTGLWTLANWYANLNNYKQAYGPYFRLFITALYSWNWLLILTYLFDLW